MIKAEIILMIYSRSFRSYVVFVFPSDFRDSLDRELTFAQSGGDTVIGTRIFFVSLVLNLVPIRQARSQPNRHTDFYTSFIAVIRASKAVPKRSTTPKQPCCVFKNRT